MTEAASRNGSRVFMERRAVQLRLSWRRAGRVLSRRPEREKRRQLIWVAIVPIRRETGTANLRLAAAKKLSKAAAKAPQSRAEPQRPERARGSIRGAQKKEGGGKCWPVRFVVRVEFVRMKQQALVGLKSGRQTREAIPQLIAHKFAASKAQRNAARRRASAVGMVNENGVIAAETPTAFCPERAGNRGFTGFFRADNHNRAPIFDEHRRVKREELVDAALE